MKGKEACCDAGLFHFRHQIGVTKIAILNAVIRFFRMDVFTSETKVNSAASRMT